MINYNYIKLGDCLELLKEIPDNSIDLIVTDPPYILETDGAGMFGKKADNYGGQRYVMKNIDFMKNGISENVLDELIRVMKKINIYIWCSQKQLPIFYKYFVEKKKCNWNLLCWHKTNPTPTCGNKYLTDTEFCLFFREKGVKVYGEYATKRTFYVSTKNLEDKKLYNHPTIKPLEIIQNIIINSSNEGDIVLDPFLGSGTTAVASKMLNRKYIGFEINKDYFEIAQKRIDDILNINNEDKLNYQTTLFDLIKKED